MSQLSSRETSDMDIDGEFLDQTKLQTRSHSFSHSDSDTVSVKSVNSLTVHTKDSQEYYTDEENYRYTELYDDDPGVSSTANKSNYHTEEGTLMEDMSIDDENFLETKENVNPTEPTDATNAFKRDHPRHKRLYQK